MPRQPMTSETMQEAHDILDLLSAEFGVLRPTLAKKRGYHTYGSYYASTMTIKLNKVVRWPDTLLHEFAHHLAYVRHHTVCHHGPRFYRALKDVVQAWGAPYDWPGEMQSVRRRASNDGIVS